MEILKRLARKILKEELYEMEVKYQNALIAGRVLKEQNDILEEAREPRMNYAITPVKLTHEEQEIVGRFSETPIMELLSKWFMAQANSNNNYLVHSVADSPEQKALWNTSVLVYEDWHNFLLNCKSIHQRQENLNLKKDGQKIPTI